MIQPDVDKRLFVYDRKRWQKFLKTDYSISSKPTVTELKNGVVLPLRTRTDIATRNAAYEGGVCDEKGEFVAGLNRRVGKPNTNLSCMKAYAFSDDIPVRHETVVYGGVLYGAFSHMMTESLSRLWWYADHPDTPFKLVFLDMPSFGGFKFWNILEAFGITRDRMEIITAPVRFDKVIVPEETFHMLSSYRPGVEKFYHYVSSKVEPASCKKVYLSRTALPAGDEFTFNEEYFENFYKKRGYEVVHPEQLPFDKQLSIVAGAEEIVATEGGLIYLSQFCRPGTKVVILRRAIDPHMATPIILQGINVNYYLIDAHVNFFPGKLEGDASIYFMGPTVCWKQYLDAMNIAYAPDEISQEIHVKPYMFDYVCQWGVRATNKRTYKDYRNTSLIDVLENINRMFLDRPINRKNYPDRDDVTKLIKQNAELKQRMEALEKLICSIMDGSAGTSANAAQADFRDSRLNSAEAGIEELRTQADILKRRLDDIEKILEHPTKLLFKRF